MNPLIAIRALVGLALPLALAYGAVGQRRSRADRRAEAAEPSRSGELSHLPRRQLRSLAAGRRDLSGYNLQRAALGGLHLSELDLTGMDLTSARFRGSTLQSARLAGAVLDFADLSGCDLRGADLSGSSLLEADLSGADLGGADLSGCRQVAMINLRGARFDAGTRWPAGFDPRAAGAVASRS